jgi:hypothetical protein
MTSRACSNFRSILLAGAGRSFNFFPRSASLPTQVQAARRTFRPAGRRATRVAQAGLETLIPLPVFAGAFPAPASRGRSHPEDFRPAPEQTPSGAEGHVRVHDNLGAWGPGTPRHICQKNLVGRIREYPMPLAREGADPDRFLPKMRKVARFLIPASASCATASHRCLSPAVRLGK